MDIYDKLKEHLQKLTTDRQQLITINAKALSQEEAIGRPKENDYPLAKGRERIMEATWLKAKGQAFTDRFGHWQGTIQDILDLPMKDNFDRALLVASLNAAMCHEDEVMDTVHCRDEGPKKCSLELPAFFKAHKLQPPIVLIGYQPRLAEQLATLGELRIVDLDVVNQGQNKAGTTILPPERTEEALEGAGCAFVTGSTIVNGTITQFMNLDIPVIFFGVTIAGPAKVLGLTRFCASAIEGKK